MTRQSILHTLAAACVVTLLLVTIAWAGIDPQGQSQGSAPVTIVSPLPLPVSNADTPRRDPFQAELFRGRNLWLWGHAPHVDHPV